MMEEFNVLERIGLLMVSISFLFQVVSWLILYPHPSETRKKVVAPYSVFYMGMSVFLLIFGLFFLSKFFWENIL